MNSNKSDKTVCIFCSSSNEISEPIKESSVKFASLLAKENFNLLYGGTTCGLMGIIANAHKSTGGYTIGVIPKYMADGGLENKELSEAVIVEDLRPRKQKMLELSDYIVALPGGVGTYDEFFDLLTLKQLKRHSKPMYLFNIDNYFQPLLDMFKHGVEHKTIKPENYDLFEIANTAEELILLLKGNSQRVITSNS